MSDQPLDNSGNPTVGGEDPSLAGIESPVSPEAILLASITEDTLSSVDTAFADDCLQDDVVEIVFGKDDIFAREDSNLFDPSADNSSVDASIGASTTSEPPSGPSSASAGPF